MDYFKLFSDFVFVKDNFSDAFVDMFLMSQCKHNIIANSSYSWWSAWLNTNIEKTVLAPRMWFSNPHLLKFNSNHLCPLNWILV